MCIHEKWITYHLPLSEDGVWVLPDLEALIGYRVEGDGEEIVVTGVSFEASRREPGNPGKWAPFTNMVDVLASDDPFLRGLALMIKTAVEADDEWQAEALQEAGWTYVGLGGNDPEGTMVFIGEAAE